MRPGSVDEPLAVLIVGREVPERRADRAPGRVDAGDHGEHRHAEHDRVSRRAHRRPVPEQLAHEVVAGLELALLDLLPQELDRCRMPRRRRSGSSTNSRESRTHPVKVSDSVLGHAEDVGDHPHGDLLGVVRRGVGVVGTAEPIDERRTDLRRQRLVLLDAAVREPRQQQPAGPGVQRRVRRDGGQARRGGRARRAPSSSTATTPTSRELKCSTSWAMAVTSA